MSFIDITTISFATTIANAILNGNKKIKWILIISILLLLSAIIINALVDYGIISPVFGIVAIVLAVTGGIGIIGIYGYQILIVERETKEEIKKAEDRVIANPNEPTAAWDLGRIKLENYLNRNLTQVRLVFFLTVFVMVSGLIMIGYGILQLYNGNSNINNAILTSSSGVLVEFIATTFLVIYKSTMQQAKDYVTVLERINAVGMSVQILESINKEESKLQDQTKAEIAKKLLDLYGNIK